METLDLLRAHAERWPLLEPQDAVKLLYQHAFGGGHLLKNGIDSVHRELVGARENLTIDESLEATESIGNGRIRLHLNAPDIDNLPTEWIWRMFYASTLRKIDSEELFRSKLEDIVLAAEQGLFSFSSETAQKAVDDYLSGGIQPICHSDRYKAAYQPCYWVMDAEMGRLVPLLTALLQKKEHHTPVLLGIDGDAAAGKTTLAAHLAEVLNCPVIHMDDFFLPSTLRTKERLTQPGGNVHYERFWEEVAVPLQNGKPVTYCPYDCHQDDFINSMTIRTCEIVIIEGSYALHPKLRDLYDVRLFLSVDEETQQTRISRRNGAEMLPRFVKEWIPMEKRYHEACGVRDCCNFIWTAETAQ